MKLNSPTLWIAVGGFLLGCLAGFSYWRDAIYGRGHTQFESAVVLFVVILLFTLLSLLGRLIFWLATAPESNRPTHAKSRPPSRRAAKSNRQT